MQQLDKCDIRPYSGKHYLTRAVWRIVELLLIRPSLPRAYRWRRFWLQRFGMTGNGSIRPTTRIWHPWLLELGEHSILGDGVEVYNLGKITIGKHTVISQRVHLCAGTHDYRDPTLPLMRPPITIGDGVWIAAEAFVGPGVSVGDNSVVGARAVVVKDVPPNVVFAGNPAKKISNRE